MDDDTSQPNVSAPTADRRKGIGSGDRAVWARRRDIAIAVLVWLVIATAAVWAAAHVIRAILVVIIAALLAYALMPAVVFLARWVPRRIAVLVVYVAFMSVIGALGYLIVATAAQQIASLGQQVGVLMTPGHDGASPLVQKLEQLGIPRAQIDAALAQISVQAQALTAGLVPLLEGVFNGVLDAVLVTVLSIYLLVDGERLIAWLRTSAPVKHRPRVTFVIEAFQRVVGGYIRGQLILCTLIGVLVGVGMALLGVPYAVLLGALAFILEFIPIIGVLISGVACVLLALTQGWLIAVLVLAYFVFVHIIEGDVVGPRIVGKAVGVHPAVSIVALIAGGELFGIWGALFASPIAGLIQVAFTELWREWRQLHASQFPEQFGAPVVPVTTAEALGTPPSTTADSDASLSAMAPRTAQPHPAPLWDPSSNERASDDGDHANRSPPATPAGAS